MASRIKVDVTSDYLCPFCLLGMRQLELAIDQFKKKNPGVEFDICLRPFQLNGLISETPMKRSEYGEKKFGAERWHAVCQSLADKFAQVGIDYKTDGDMSQSHLAHRLTEYALQVNPAAQQAVAMDLFNLYHVEGVHLSSRPHLAAIGAKHGLFKSQDEGVQWLHSQGCDLEVRKAYLNAQRMGITGVPFFVFQDKYAASGAMGVEEFVDILGEITSRENGASPKPMNVQGEACLV